MKRSLLLVPIFLLILLNACGSTTANISPAEGTAVGQTQTATVWTLTITPTLDPSEPNIVEWLNAELSNADPLEKTLDAKYQVIDSVFSVGSNGAYAVFRVDVRCECVTNIQCCVPERMFVVTANAMKTRADKIVDQVPATVIEVKVVCHDRTIQLGVMSAWWSDLRAYLLDQINGYQLGSRVFRSSIP